ncbi:MAG TPA: lytic transglycosylase domain-containing protein [Vicinamibacterales bacterium]|nr:lytic transglycosylase domain-containing protein [Vicinamibacterales bacterium]
MQQRLSPRVLVLTAVAGLLPALVPVVSAQSLPANFSYSRSENGTPLISGTGFVTSAPPVRRPRATQFDALITQHAEANGLSPVLVRAVIQTESAFNPRAVSHVGAMGLMQLMPGTARELGVVDPFDPDDNIRGGTKYLRTLLDRFDGNVEFALAAYNAGPGAVERYDGIPPYRETRNYVAKLSNMIKGVKTITRGSMTIYEVTEATPDGREIKRFTDKKPDAPHSIVSLRAR